MLLKQYSFWSLCLAPEERGYIYIESYCNVNLSCLVCRLKQITMKAKLNWGKHL